MYIHVLKRMLLVLIVQKKTKQKQKQKQKIIIQKRIFSSCKLTNTLSKR